MAMNMIELIQLGCKCDRLPFEVPRGLDHSVLTTRAQCHFCFLGGPGVRGERPDRVGCDRPPVAAAVERVKGEAYTLDPDIMLLMAGLGIAINLVIALILHGCGCHGHFHSAYKSEKQNINVRAALVHVVADTLQTVAVMAAAVVVKFWPEYKIADPILTFVFGFIVVVTTLPILRDLAHVLMEGTPRNVDYGALLNDLEGLPGVRTVHNLHIWSLTLDKNALSVHLGIVSVFMNVSVSPYVYV
ncbi:proton-coupled zinc antiporter SLC30A2-like [Penaeus indicus]|uniref:proton-coupled zinc antiporter SLC30A2-like n=1 Tax=Penaeus indicus TaxID=29960 RepID=UPI00300D75B4